MARDQCADCEQDFPGGEGLVDGVCLGCREARALHKPDHEGPPSEASESEEQGRRGWWPPGRQAPEPTTAEEEKG